MDCYLDLEVGEIMSNFWNFLSWLFRRILDVIIWFFEFPLDTNGTQVKDFFFVIFCVIAVIVFVFHTFDSGNGSSESGSSGKN